MSVPVNTIVNDCQSLIRIAVILFCSSVLVACGGSGSSGSSTSGVGIKGAGIKGPVEGATIAAYAVDAAGIRTGSLLTSANTDAEGKYNLVLNPASADIVLLVLTNGIYQDEATGNKLALGAAEELLAYAHMPSTGEITVNITPLTTLTAAHAVNLVSNGGQTLANAIDNAAAQVSVIFGISDVFATAVPAIVDLGGASQQEINHALTLAGFSQLDSDDGVPRTVFDILEEISADLSADGIWGNAGAGVASTELLVAIDQFRMNAGVSAALSSTVISTLNKNPLDIEAAGNNVNNLPFANDDSAAVNEGASVNIDLAANDTDADDGIDIASIAIISNPANGSLVVNVNGSVDYTHNGSETITDSFTYTVDDNSSETSNTATVTVTIVSVNDPPFANNDSANVSEGASVNIDLAGNDLDADNGIDPASIVIINGPTNGVLLVNTDGSVDYSHNGSETNLDNFTYTIDDASAATSNTATVNLTILPVNDVPVANDDMAVVNEGTSVNIDLAANDTDADNGIDLASIVITTNPANGSLVVNTNGSVDYTHNGTETTSDTFVYSIDDLSGVTSNSATVNIMVTPVNDLPVANDDSATVGQTASVNIDLASNDADADNGLDVASISIISNPANGTVTVNADGTVLYMHDGTFTTTDNFTYTIDDVGGATSNVATVDVSILEGFNEALYAIPAVSSTSKPERQYQANDGFAIFGNGWVGTESVATGSSWIRLNFDSTKTIYRVALSDVIGSAQLQAGSIEFSDGSTIPIATPLTDDGTPVDFIFDAKQTDWVQVNLTQAVNIFGLSEIAVYSTLDQGQTKQAEDLFNDATTASDWTLVNECNKGTPSWDQTFQFWAGAGNQYRQTGDCRGFSVSEGIEIGSYLVWNQTTTTGMDLRFGFRSDDTGDVVNDTWLKGAMGVFFGYQDSNNYYRLDFSKQEGHRKLWKKEAGVYTELNTSPQSYTPGDYPASYSPQAWNNLRVVHTNGVIVVYSNGEKILAVEDSTFTGGQTALFCARNESCAFDNVVLLDSPSNPILGLNLSDGGNHKSGGYFVSVNGNLDLSAVVTDTTGIGGIEFVVDEGAPGETVLIDFAAPYNALFNALTTGEHTIRAFLLDATATRFAASEATEELPLVGTGGINIVGLGDSITSGLLDDVSADDISGDGRNTSGGYQTVLNDHLTADNSGKPVTILNEGNPGEQSSEAASRIAAVLARTPGTQAYLTIYGANDSGGATPVLSGLGTVPDTVIPTTFKDYMQQMIDQVLAAGKQIILAKTSPHMTNLTRDLIIQEYNLVIDELVLENGFTYTPPDFHTYFTNNPGQMANALHPDGIGYQAMAGLWCTAINNITELPGIACTP